MFLDLVRAQLKAEIRDKTILVRSLPFVGVVLLLFAFAFDPDRGIMARISPGLCYVVVTFASMFIYVRDAHNKREQKFISSFAVESSVLFISRVATNFVLTLMITIFTGIFSIFLFSPDMHNLLQVLIVAILITFALSIVGAIYSPLVSKLHDSGQLLSLVVIPVLLPALLSAIESTNSALGQNAGQSWKWLSLLAIFDVMFICIGVLASDSLED
ncbi:MAG: heme exporter protein CcmB [Acidimicrobiia bacterium]